MAKPSSKIDQPPPTLISAAWFRALVKDKKNRKFFTLATGKLEDMIGGMFFYEYDPKHKAKLPIWDQYPLVIPIELYKDGFLAINMHFVKPNARKVIIDKIMALAPLDSGKRVSISYNFLKAIASHKVMEGCIKRYLVDHINTKLVTVDINDWGQVVMLPLAKFNKIR